MKEKIILEAKKLLEKDGLIFSVDDLAKNLKIGKQTIYQYFKTKEELAVVLFDSIYDEIINNMLSADSDIKMTILLKEALDFSDEKLFNRYSINEVIKEKVYILLEKCKLIALDYYIKYYNSAKINGFIDLFSASIIECQKRKISIEECMKIFLWR